MRCVAPTFLRNSLARPPEWAEKLGAVPSREPVVQWEEVPCGYCPACLENKRAVAAERARFECAQTGYLSGYFLTLTFDDDHLPMSAGMTRREAAKAERNIAEFLSEHQEERSYEVELAQRMPSLHGPLTEPLPTLSHTGSQSEWQRYRRRVDELFARKFGPPANPTREGRKVENGRVRPPLMMAVGEYGDLYGRPHYHALVPHASHAEVEALAGCWKGGIVHVMHVTSKNIAGYITKDIVKGVLHRHVYKMRGMAPPKILWPRSPMMAARQVPMMVSMLTRVRESLSAFKFEWKVQVQNLDLHGNEIPRLGTHYQVAKSYKPLGPYVRKQVFEAIEPLRDPRARLRCWEHARELAALRVEMERKPEELPRPKGHPLLVESGMAARRREGLGQWQWPTGENYSPEYAESVEADRQARKLKVARMHENHRRVMHRKRSNASRCVA